jgi:hypothetical protein
MRSVARAAGLDRTGGPGRIKNDQEANVNIDVSPSPHFLIVERQQTEDPKVAALVAAFFVG